MTKKENIQRWHNAYQKALSQSPTIGGDGVVRIFEKLVGSPPLPKEDAEAHDVYLHLLEDLRRMEDFERNYPLAMVAFGSARLADDDPYYLLAAEVGERLAEEGYLVRTGAGPGIMDAVPAGYKRMSSLLSLGSNAGESVTNNNGPTQGIRIELPFEQAVSPSIDTNTMMKTFAIRRTALIWNSRGIAVFPGGLGTINELFEAWVGAADRKVDCPIVVIPTAFYRPFLDAIEQSAVVQRRTIQLSDFNLVEHSSHDAAEAVRLLRQPMRSKKSGTQFTLREKLLYLRHELGRGLTTVSNLRPAIFFMGSVHSLSIRDPEVQFVGSLSKNLVTTTSFGIRIGVGGVIYDAISQAVGKVATSNENEDDVIQRILMTDEMAKERNSTDAHFESRSAHCETLIDNAMAAIFLPSDIAALNVLFALVCEIQTKRRTRMPVFLVGRKFWQPILNGLQETLLSNGEDGQFIESNDLNIMEVIGTTQQDLCNVMERMECVQI
eukprot:CAMPEP_0183716672 /NCGR_PEP_ID=MMETSP0737-20130205/10489_1 /TAXON_ID=385413 /ORGANISM="Thalassiosira miniscula, Strain CCMP1093" /LENGTH=493 /DNA_ID=CAMNT_0025945967 /DNA_START=274 /DNA_END=1755 /DNA_ORIENTATION=-